MGNVSSLPEGGGGAPEEGGRHKHPELRRAIPGLRAGRWGRVPNVGPGTRGTPPSWPQLSQR